MKERERERVKKGDRQGGIEKKEREGERVSK